MIEEGLRERGAVPTYREIQEAVSRRISQRSIVEETRGKMKLPPDLLKAIIEDKALLHEN